MAHGLRFLHRVVVASGDQVDASQAGPWCDAARQSVLVATGDDACHCGSVGQCSALGWVVGVGSVVLVAKPAVPFRSSGRGFFGVDGQVFVANLDAVIDDSDQHASPRFMSQVVQVQVDAAGSRCS